MLKVGLSCFVAAGAVCAGALSARSAVEGRFVRIDALTHTMEYSELEIFSGGTNLLRGHAERVSVGEIKSADGTFAKKVPPHSLVDGNTNSEQRCQIHSPDPQTSFACLEADLGTTLPVDTVTVHVSRWDNPMVKKWFDDPDGWRVVTVLDESRKVVFSGLVTLFTPECTRLKGVISVRPEPAKGPFIGRVIPPASRGWFSLGEFMTGYLNVRAVPAPADSGNAARREEFSNRLAPESVELFAKRFFDEVDVNAKGLEAVRAALKAGKSEEAIRAFSRRFFERLGYFETGKQSLWQYSFPADPRSGAMMEAEDLLNGRKVDRKARTVYVGQPADVLDFSASVVPWDKPHPRSLLLAYAATGEKKYLARWAEIMDEKSIFFQRWADAGSRRDYMPLGQLGALNAMLLDLHEAQKLRPGLCEDLPSATLPRLLSLHVEEALPTYWRLARRTVFNHQYNIWCGAYTLSRILPDFHVGRRLEQEVAQHFERLWTIMLHRDGSMAEVADVGHMRCPLQFFSRYDQLKVDKPAWFTADMENYFRHYCLMSARYAIRYLAPSGIEHRSGENADLYSFGMLEPLLASDAKNNEVLRALAPNVLREPDARAIVDTVFGRGRERSSLSKERQRAYDVVAQSLPGGYQGQPETVSDYMPYAGIHFLRRDWSPDASFVEMMCQPPGGGANGRCMDSFCIEPGSWWGTEYWDTQFHYWDFAEPLLLARPLKVDGQQQCQSYETRGWACGSKTERMVEAVEKPLQNRFYSSPQIDYQECFFRGAYQTWSVATSNGTGGFISSPGAWLAFGGPAVTNVNTTRQLFMVHEPRLLVSVDRVCFSDDGTHRLSAPLLMLPEEPEAKIEADAARREIRLIRPKGAHLTVRQFGVDGLRYETLKPVKGHLFLDVQWQAKRETVLVSVLEPRSSPTAGSALAGMREVNADGKVGFEATTREGKTITLSVPRQRVRTATGVAPEQALLTVADQDGGLSGLALGTEAVTAGKRVFKTGMSDCAFSLAGGWRAKPQLRPVWRPIDPPSFLPATEVFIDTQTVSIVSGTADVEIRYTTDGSEPVLTSPLYTAPFDIGSSCMIQARAFRKGFVKVPFATEGTRVSDISFARFRKEPARPAVKADATRPGLAYDYMEGSWFRLFGYADRQAAKSSGTVDRLMDVGMRQTEGTFAVRYSGYLDVPAAGVYTFHAPKEYVVNGCEPGYDLRVFVDGEEWRLGQLWHGRGAWSVPLAKGLHRFQVVYADARDKDVERQRIDYWWGYPSPWVVWRGVAPVLELSGPGLARQPVPTSWLKR